MMKCDRQLHHPLQMPTQRFVDITLPPSVLKNLVRVEESALIK